MDVLIEDVPKLESELMELAAKIMPDGQSVYVNKH